MKTYCNSCNTSSLNFLHKETGIVYCTNCGSALRLGIEIINALSSKKMFLPDDFFKQEEVVQAPARNLTQVAVAQKQPVQAVTKSAEQLALERRQYYSTVTKPTDDSVSSSVSKPPKVSREEAAARKAAALAQTEQIIAEQGAIQNPNAGWFKNKPNLAKDVERSGMSLQDAERMIDPD